MLRDQSLEPLQYDPNVHEAEMMKPWILLSQAKVRADPPSPLPMAEIRSEHAVDKDEDTNIEEEDAKDN